MIAEIFLRGKRSISRREAELEWRHLRDQSATTATKGDITNAVQHRIVTVQRMDIGCFKEMLLLSTKKKNRNFPVVLLLHPLVVAR